LSSLREFFGPQRYWLHILLFLLSVFTTTIAGVAWLGLNPFDLQNFDKGLMYGCMLLLFLTNHEFGHFIVARMNNVSATLPFYIPFPGMLLGVGPNFGTFGAVIKTRSRIPSRRVMFDIGVAGPIAGFVVCLAILIVGFATLPGIEYLQAIHPGYPANEVQGPSLYFGKTLLYSMCEQLFANPNGYVPPMTEVYHYPLLCVGWFGLFVTALNLLPIGQLDGGHLVYGMFGSRIHSMVGKVTALVLFLISIPDSINSLAQAGMFEMPAWLEPLVIAGGSTWFVWAIIASFLMRFKHPPSEDESKLDTKRFVIGLLTILIFILCFTPSPLVFSLTGQ
jgi:membrane-associated protease RseP (regulator of RpoE activity)